MCSTASNLAPNFNFYLFSNKVYQQIKTQTKSQISASNHTCKILLPIVNLLSDWFPIKTNQTKNTERLDFTGFIRVFNGVRFPLESLITFPAIPLFIRFCGFLLFLRKIKTNQKTNQTSVLVFL